MKTNLIYMILFFTTFTIFSSPSIKQINNEFDDVALKYDIPSSLLKALAYKQSYWSINNGKNDEMNKGMYGIMGLYQKDRVSSIQYGASLLNIDPIYGLINYKWNIEISARIISEIRENYIKSGIKVDKLEDYYNILIDYLDYDESIRGFSEGLVIKIYKLINEGYSVSLNNETLRILPKTIKISDLESSDITKFYVNYRDITSLEDIQFIYTANKYNGRASGVPVDQVLIHIMQGSFEGTISWFKNTSSEVSAHYLISKNGEIVQMVKLEDRAWHAGIHNNRSVGIEHEGVDDSYSGTASIATEEEYQASAMLTRWLTEKYNIPRVHRDAYHDENGNFTAWDLQRPELADLPGILGHHDTNGKEFCPGPHWDWNYYMQLVNESSGEGEIEVISPLPNEVVDNPVVFKCRVDGDIVKVKYFADETYLLGESSNKDDNFRVEYTFTGIGVRAVSFKAYDANGGMIYTATKTHDIEIIEAGEGSVTFTTPLDNTESVNPVILESNVTADVKTVKYFAEDTIFLGESSNQSDNFRVERAFNQIGARVLNAKGYNVNGVLISNAEDKVSVVVQKIDENVIEECISECDTEKETKCNLNGNISICEKVDECLIWQVSQECGGDEYCEEGKCLRRETDRECDDECIFVDQKICNNNSVQVCKLDSNNCLKYFLDETCQDGFVCQVGVCIDKNKVENKESPDEGCSYSNQSNTNSIFFIILLLLSIKLFNLKKNQQ